MNEKVRLANAIRLPDGTWIRGRGLRKPVPDGPSPEEGLYLGTARLRRRHDRTLTWPHAWIDWPDFLVPRNPEYAVERIQDLYEQAKAGRLVEVACNGGIGRTGTAIACMAMLAGLQPAEAISWTRANFHHRAIETPFQRRWALRFPAMSATGD
jgi:protein-tyrosine phosphatase